MKNNMKIIFIFGLFLFSFLGFTKEAVRPAKSSHILYVLRIKASEGLFHPDVTNKSVLNLYKQPQKGATAVFQVPLVTEQRDRPASFYKLFDDGSAVFYFMGISSKEKKGDFYNIFYKEEYYWVNKSNLNRIVNIEECANNGSEIDIPVSIAKFYEKPNGKEIILPSSLNEYLKGKQTSNVEFSVVEHKWVKDKLWIKVKTDHNSTYSGRHYNGKIDAWVHPFSKGGKPLFYYAYKEGC